jgi:peptidoglycan/LPS O-acetylase OafA/YrhL
MYLPRSLRAGFYASAALLLASGIAWLAIHYEALPGTQASALALEVHGAAAMAVLFLAGGLLALHAPRAWRERRNRATGLATAVLLAALAITGYLLYYAGDEKLRQGASLVHWGLGLAAPMLAWLHVFLGRRSR